MKEGKIQVQSDIKFKIYQLVLIYYNKVCLM